MSWTPAQHIKNKTLPVSLTAINWLGSDQQGADVLTMARLLISIEQAAKKVLPAELAHVFRAARIDRQQITLAVPSAAHAAKLRQLTPRIIRQLAQSGWNHNEISVKVQADLLRFETKTPRVREIAPLDDKALKAFRTLQENLNPGPLANAVKQLLARHGNR